MVETYRCLGRWSIKTILTTTGECKLILVGIVLFGSYLVQTGMCR